VWSDVSRWTSRVPLPQDDVVVGNVPGQIGIDMPRLGRSVDFTGFAGTFAIITASVSTAVSVYGNLIMSNSMLYRTDGVYNAAAAIDLRGTAGFTFTPPSGSLPYGVRLMGGGYTLMSAMTITRDLEVNSGALYIGANNTSVPRVIVNGGTIDLGSGIMSLTLNAAVTSWNFISGNVVAGTGEIVIAGATTNIRVFAGGAKTYPTLRYQVAGSTGELQITGSNTFANIYVSDATSQHGIAFAAGSTTTITGTFSVQGAAGRFSFINTIGNANSKHFLVKQQGLVKLDYVSISHSTVSGGAHWYAGSHSTNVTDNTGWLFSDPDMTLPVVSINSVDKSKISRVAGQDVSTFNFQSDRAYEAYQLRLVPTNSSLVTSGTLIESGSGGSANTDRSVNVTDDELVAAGAGEGNNVVKAFVADASTGLWSA
jgi:hypothetical protein